MPIALIVGLFATALAAWALNPALVAVREIAGAAKTATGAAAKLLDPSNPVAFPVILLAVAFGAFYLWKKVKAG